MTTSTSNKIQLNNYSYLEYDLRAYYKDYSISFTDNHPFNLDAVFKPVSSKNSNGFENGIYESLCNKFIREEKNKFIVSSFIRTKSSINTIIYYLYSYHTGSYFTSTLYCHDLNAKVINKYFLNYVDLSTVPIIKSIIDSMINDTTIQKYCDDFYIANAKSVDFENVNSTIKLKDKVYVIVRIKKKIEVAEYEIIDYWKLGAYVKEITNFFPRTKEAYIGFGEMFLSHDALLKNMYLVARKEDPKIKRYEEKVKVYKDNQAQYQAYCDKFNYQP